MDKEIFRTLKEIEKDICELGDMFHISEDVRPILIKLDNLGVEIFDYYLEED